MKPKLPFTTPPKSICILRLSAIGDCTHMLPVIHAIQAHWPETKITWVIGKLEYALFNELPNVDFVVFDKSQGRRAYASIKTELKKKQFDVLLHMQAALRASLISRHIKAPIKIGFDKARAKDMQWIFTNQHIQGEQRVHVIETFYQFLKTLGVPQPETPSWQLPVSADLSSFSLPDKFVVLAPCSSRADKDWSVQGYIDIIQHLTNTLNTDVVLAGGPSPRELSVASEIAKEAKATNLVGKTSLKQLYRLISQSKLLISPDSGPAHISTVTGTPVISLFASTNPYRTGPYLSLDHVVNEYPKALEEECGLAVEDAKWGQRVRSESAMLRIQTQDVIAQLDKLAQ